MQYGVYFLSSKFSIIFSEPSGEENIGKIWNEKNMPYCTRITCDNLFIVNTKSMKHINVYQSITFICKHFISHKNLHQSLFNLHQANKFKPINLFLITECLALVITYIILFAFCISKMQQNISPSKIYFVYFYFERNLKLCKVM